MYKKSTIKRYITKQEEEVLDDLKNYPLPDGDTKIREVILYDRIKYW